MRTTTRLTAKQYRAECLRLDTLIKELESELESWLDGTALAPCDCDEEWDLMHDAICDARKEREELEDRWKGRNRLP